MTPAPRKQATDAAAVGDLLSLVGASTQARLRGGLFHDPERASMLLRRLGAYVGLPHRSVPFLEGLVDLLGEAADPDQALVNLTGWVDRLGGSPSVLISLMERPALTTGLLRLFSHSQHLSDVLIRDPELYAMLGDAREPRDIASLRTEAKRICAIEDPDRAADALRRLKRREYLRLGWLDLTEQADFGAIVAGVSDLAATCIEAALNLATRQVAPTFPTASPGMRFCVVAFGKLGGRELNYSSDVDLMFFYDTEGTPTEGQQRYAARVAQTAISLLSAATSEGFLYRVDMRLRPEGRAGAIIRSWHSLRIYFDRYIETWERQALIKATGIAGDPALCDRFGRLARRASYLRYQPTELFAEVREMKMRLERRAAAAGEVERNVKEGSGAIRDVEFTVQLLQLLFGAAAPAIRTPNTLEAVDRLHHRDLLTEAEAKVLRQGYVFFRRVEHFLQLASDLPIRMIPKDERQRTVLARGMGLATLTEFDQACASHQGAVRRLTLELLARLGLGEAVLEDPLERLVLALDDEASLADLTRTLERCQFSDPAAALDEIRALAVGGQRYQHDGSTRRAFAKLARPLLDACAASPDPNGALATVSALADRKLLHRSFYRSLAEQPEFLARLCLLGGSSKVLRHVWLRRPELIEVSQDPRLEADVAVFDELAADLEQRMLGATSARQRGGALRRFQDREFVRIATRELLAATDALSIAEEYADLVDVLLDATLRLACQNLAEAGHAPPDPEGFLAIGLGRVGGRELHFCSDLDLLYVFDSDQGEPADYQRLAQEFDRVISDPLPHGRLFDLDLRLRPEGSQGALILSLRAIERYYRERGQPWEFLALQRARRVAGGAALEARFLETISPIIHRAPTPPEWWVQIRHLKDRLERERTTSKTRLRNIKLGPGGLADVEFLVQAHQLRHAARNPALREPNTRIALRLLVESGHLTGDEGADLETALEFLTRLRQRLALLDSDLSSEVMPSPGPTLTALARGLGFDSDANLEQRREELQARAREIFVKRFAQVGESADA